MTDNKRAGGVQAFTWTVWYGVSQKLTSHAPRHTHIIPQTHKTTGIQNQGHSCCVRSRTYAMEAAATATAVATRPTDAAPFSTGDAAAVVSGAAVVVAFVVSVYVSSAPHAAYA